MFKNKKRIVLFIALIVFIASVLYQAICVNNYTEVPGKIIEVNNHDMHIFATGKREDKPVYENWEKTQNELLKISSRTEQIIFPNTKHYIHHEKANGINERIKSWKGELQ
ncbi:MULTISPECIES: hypothetical protein [Bacillus]|uniref:Uncharacterized protein n=1 Tax=Bacillus pseudomycoides TaxID=64104 RepID=A0A1Y3MDX5_9BACI|nr:MULTISPECIES: hypothetical protein [Bacillus cereus group]EOP53245.1 hypothetical protein IIW_01781 [Bacillus cereus VD136]EOP72562.1 hypothetical protein KOW_01130 [Bacillus cereus VDM006]EOQ07220.1 hypothetical protein KOY_03444 [Bacillus cereus VDM021]OOG94339.1 hypothetical protein BTH41_02038 [Bacillus mycoides]MDF2084280.1 hypothetical protein [Bacillus pseudomycoides]